MNTPDFHLEPELLSAYLDNEVSAEERRFIQSHLPECAACRQELEGLRYTVALVRAVPPRPVPRPFYVTESMVGIEQRAPARGVTGWLRMFAPLGAALAAMLMFVVLARPLFFGGTASPSAAPQPEIAVVATDAIQASEAAAEPPAESAETRQGDAAVEATAEMETALAPEGGVESAQDSGTSPTAGFSITAPIVGAAGEEAQADGAGADITATSPLTTVDVVTPESGNADRDDTMITPLTTNTVMIVAAILLVALGGLLIFFVRQRR